MKIDSRPLTPAVYALVALGFVAAAVLFDVATEHVLAGQLPPWQTRMFTAVASALVLTWALRWGDQRLRRVAAESRQSNERARRFQESLLDALPVGVFFKDREGRYIGCNAHFTEVLGLTEDDIRGKTVSDLWPTELAATYRRKDEELMRSRQIQHYEFRLIDKNGRIREVAYSKGPLYDERGEVAGLVGGFFDISDHKCALNALAVSERKFRTLFASARDAILLLDETGFLDCNPATAQVMGLPCDQLIGRSPTEFAPEMQPSGERSADVAARKIAAAMAGEPQRFEWRAKRADGQLTDHEVHLCRSDFENRPCLQAIVRDITERKRTESRLQQREADLRAAQAVAHVGSWHLDVESGALDWTEETYRIFEVAQGTAQTLDMFIGYIHEDDRDGALEVWRLALAGGPFDIEYRIRAGGRVKWVRDRAEFLRNEQGVAEHAIGTVQDVTQRRENEAELRRHREELTRLVDLKTRDLSSTLEELREMQFAMENVGIGIMCVDYETGRITYTNRFACEFLGYAEQEFLTLSIHDVDPNCPEDVYLVNRDEIKRLGHVQFEAQHRRRDGTLRPVEMTVYFQDRGPTRTPRFIAFSTDISARKAAECELVKARDAAQAANAAKSEFLANMSHEIRTPLNAILGLSYLLRRDAASGDQRSKLEKIDVAGRHLLALINDVLDLSKIEAGKLVIEKDNFRLSSVLASVASIVRDAAVDKGLKLEVHPDHVPDLLWGDVTRIRQALLNFASNAVKFTEHGTVSMSAHLLESSSRSVRVRLEVTDSGIGLTEEQRSRLFQPFHQADGSTSRKYGGTGLGLSLTRRLIELMGGTVGVESTYGQGSTFWFEVTLERGHGVDVADGAIRVPMPKDVQLRSRHRGARILLAEDNAVNVEVVLELLQSVDMDVTVATNGKQALNAAMREKFDLVLMDVQMPEMNGIEATVAIRGVTGWERIPIVALTANAFAEDRRACTEAGMNDVITKPVEPERLYATLEHWLSRAVARSGAGPAGSSTDDSPGVVLDRLRAMPGMDIDRGLSSLRGNSAKYFQLAWKFTVSTAENLTRCSDLIEIGDQDAVLILVHGIKGAASTLGFTAISESAAGFESLLREPQWLAANQPQAQERLGELSRSVSVLEGALMEAQ